MSVLRGHPLWRPLIHALAGTAAAVSVLALVTVARQGLSSPLIAVAGVAVTVAVNRVYVVVHRHGDVREGIDLSEVPLVALALLLSPAEAVLAFAVGSVLVELFMDRAPIKKAFNVGVRITGAALLVLPVVVLPVSGDLTPGRTAAVAAGAVLYWAFSAGATAVVLGSVQQTSAMRLLVSGAGARTMVWACCVVVGVTAARAADSDPIVLLGLCALLGLLAATALAYRRAEKDTERLEGVLAATAGIQSSVGAHAQDTALLTAARDLLPWRDVEIRSTPPVAGEVGHPLPSEDDRPRWLLARPRRHGDPWNVEDARVLEALAVAASVTIELAQLQARVAEQALIDPLTSVGNRRRLDAELARLTSTTSGFAVVMIDLDGFKAINDGLGHETGDAVLTGIAARLQASRRDGDVVTRLGGDEFAVVLPGVETAEAAIAVAEKISEAVARPLHVGDWRLRVRGSVGVAIAPLDGRSPQELLRAADERMYDDKRARAHGRHDLVAVHEQHGRRSTDRLEVTSSASSPR